MMTQVKSGFTAKLKVLLIVPFAIALFLFFADMTFYNGERSFSNFIALKSSNEITNFLGIWENLDKESYGRLLTIDGNNLSILENEFDLKEYKASMTKTKIVLELWPGEILEIAYSYKGNILQVWWSDSQSSQYKRTEETNSLAYSIGELASEIDLPVIEEYVNINWPEYFNIVFTGRKLQVGRQLGTLKDLDAMIEKQKESLNKLSMKYMTVKLFIDKNVLMKDLDIIQNTLRKNNLLKVAFMGYPVNQEGSAILAHTYGRTSKLPPLEGIKILSDQEVKDQGIDLFTIKAMDKNSSPGEIRSQLKKSIKNSEKYITPLEYEGTTLYSDVLAYYDMVFAIVGELRDDYAVEHFNTKYDALSKDQQNKVRTRYPMTIILKNIQENPDDPDSYRDGIKK